MKDSRFHHPHHHPQSMFNNMEPSSFFRSRFPETRFHHHDTFFNDPSDTINSNDQKQQQPKVHHIPIQIESRTASEMANSANALRSQSNIGSREQSPMPVSSPSNADYHQQQPAQHLNSSHYAPPVPPPTHFQQQQYQQPQQLPMKNEQSFTRSSASPRMVRSVPIQISKSNSSPSATNERPPQQHQQNIPVNESLSDPTIADPNKVYAMSYEPIKKNESTPESIAFSDKEIPKVVPLAYESVIESKQAAQINQQNAPPTALPPPPSFSSNDDVQHEKQSNEQSISPNQQTEKKEETPFDYIDEILDDLKNWEQQVHECQATTADDKGYKWLDEMLTLCVLRLDCINIDGDDELRKYRKQAINEVNRVVALLESKLHSEKKSNSTNVEHIKIEDNDDGMNKDNSVEKIDKKKDGKRTFKIFSRKSNKPSSASTNSKDTDSNNNDLKTNDSDQSANNTINDNSGQKIGRETEV